MTPKSLWINTIVLPRYPQLTQSQTADAVVIGGGISGLMSAYLLSKKGKKVAVIEGRTLLSGTTGHTTAHISLAHDLIYDRLIQRFGKQIAKGYAQANQVAIQMIEDSVNELEIDCDFKRVDEYIYAPTANDNSGVEKEYQATQELNLGASIVNVAPLPWQTGRAIRYSNQARFHPGKFLSRIAKEIVASGGCIFEQTRAIDVVEETSMKVITDNGEIKANDVIVATLFPFLDRGFYFARQSPYTSYVIAATINQDLPDAMFDSSETHSHYFRLQPYQDGYVVLIGGEGHKTGTVKDTAQNYHALEAFARKHLDIKDILFRWSTHDMYPHDGLPYIGKYLPTSEHLWVATGFQGWGMTNATAAGILLSDLITSKTNLWSEVYDPGRFKITPELIKENAQVGKMFAKSKLTSKPPLDTSKVKPGESQIMDQEGEKVAVYKDTEGNMHAVSAVCQHMGCNVGFNTAEKTWDCPCHGSRYTVDGQVLYGPTVKPLPKIKRNE